MPFLFRASLVVFVFIATIVIYPYYIGGDQFHYRRVYSELYNLGLFEGYIFYNIALSSYEFVHFFLTWVFSKFVDKIIFDAFFNAVLALLIIMFFDKKRVFFIITVFFVVSNFYVLVLFFSADRLKFAIIFLLLSIYYFERIKLFGLFGFLALMAHIQLSILYAGMVLSWAIKKIIRVFRVGKISVSFFYVLLGCLAFIFIMWGQIYTKFIAYFEISSIYEYIRLGIFFLMALWYSKNKSQTFLVFLPLFGAVMLFGGERVNLLGYFVFLFYALQVNRGVNIGVIITSLYFAYASYGFLVKIFLYGDGFYGV